jgi:hypothetical protein
MGIGAAGDAGGIANRSTLSCMGAISSNATAAKPSSRVGPPAGFMAAELLRRRTTRTPCPAPTACVNHTQARAALAIGKSLRA